jgi:putative transposase
MAFWRTYYHIIWATRERAPLIQPAIEERLYAYIAARALALECHIYAIGGWVDHMHLITAIPPKIAVAEVVRQLKGASAHYANHELQLSGNFEWQRGYGVLSISERNLETALAYVRNQKQHHTHGSEIRVLETLSDESIGPDRSPMLGDGLREPAAAYRYLGEAPF